MDSIQAASFPASKPLRYRWWRWWGEARDQPPEWRKEELRGVGECRHTPEKDEDRKNDNDVVDAAELVHPVRLTDEVADPLAVLEHEGGDQDAEETEEVVHGADTTAMIWKSEIRKLKPETSMKTERSNQKPSCF